MGSDPVAASTADDLVPADEVDDVDPFDLLRAEDDPDSPDESAIPQVTPLSPEEIVASQRTDAFCQNVITLLGTKQHRAFYEDPADGILKRRHPADRSLIQIVVPAALRERLCTMAHAPVLAGHPGQSRMFYTLRESYYWPQMAADIAATVCNCAKCARNRLRLRRHLNRLQLFPATGPLESVAIDILGPLPRSATGKRFLLVITDRYTKLTQVAPLATITAYHVAVAFCEVWVFKYGPPASLLSDNGTQVTSKFFQSVCKLLGLRNDYTSAYHPQTNGQTERYNRTVLEMLRSYVNEHQSDWDRYASTLTYAYNNHVHRSTGTKPFDLVLSRPPPDFTRHHPTPRPRASNDVRRDFVQRLDAAFSKADATLRAVQARYKRDFDKRVRPTRNPLVAGDFVFLDTTDGVTKMGKLRTPAEGPHRILSADTRTVLLDRDGIAELVSVDRVVKAPAPPTGEAPLYMATEAELADKATEGPSYVVERITDHAFDDDGQTLFHVKWEGFRERTWEPRKNLPEELVMRYFARRGLA